MQQRGGCYMRRAKQRGGCYMRRAKQRGGCYMRRAKQRGGCYMRRAKMTKCLVKNGICYSTIPLMKMMNFMAFNKVVLLTLFCCFYRMYF